MEALTYSDLRRVQKDERNSSELQELDDNFYLKAREYLERKENTGDRDYRSAKRVFENIISLREEKVVENARISLKNDLNISELNMLPREKKLFRSVRDAFQEHRSELQQASNTGKTEASVEEKRENPDRPQTEEPADEPGDEDEASGEEPSAEPVEDGYQRIKITSDVPEFMGTDLEPYGPFEGGEKAVIPEDNAEILVNRGNAEEI